MLILCQTRTPDTDRLQVRGAFTQKKKLWEAVSGIEPGVGRGLFAVLNDVTGKAPQATLPRLCSTLASVGRATLVAPDGRRRFLVVECSSNKLRDWDTGDDGGPRLNPCLQGAAEE